MIKVQHPYEIIWFDSETFNEVPIKHGTFKYKETVKTLLLAWAKGHGDIHVADVSGGEPVPDELDGYLRNPDIVLGIHNSQFDLAVLESLGYSISPSRVLDTMVVAYEHSLPGSLGALCEVLNIKADEAKDKDGKRLIQFFCKPRPKNVRIRVANRDTHPEEWKRFVEYARMDIEAMRQVYKRLPRWNITDREIELWRLDQEINARGFRVDVDLAKAALAASEVAKHEIGERTRILTKGKVTSPTQRDMFLEFLESEHGIKLDDLKKSTVTKQLKSGVDADSVVEELLTARLQGAGTATKKYETLLNSVSSDGRLRGTIQFCGASRTGRFSGRVFQPHNLPQPSHKQDEIDAGIVALKEWYQNR